MNTIIVLLALLATASAFVANTGAARSLVKANKVSMKMDFPKIAAIAPFVATPAAFASVDVSLQYSILSSMYLCRGSHVYLQQNDNHQLYKSSISHRCNMLKGVENHCNI